jgi:hypothetical protein
MLVVENSGAIIGNSGVLKKNGTMGVDESFC